MVGDAADQSLENSPGRRVDLIFERMDRVSFWNFKGSPGEAILFLKSMSERGGSDIERLRN